MIITLLFFLIFTWLIVRLTRRASPSLSTPEVVLAFGAKVLLSCAYGYIFLRYYHGDDTWEIHQGGLNEWQWLQTSPGQFFLDLLPIKAWQVGGGNAQAAMLYYFDKLEWHLQVKPLAIANLFTRGNYYANTVFFSFLTFWGHYWLFRLACRYYPQHRSLLLALIFLFPPVLFWLSGIRSDGLLFLCTSLVLLQGNQWLRDKKKAAAWYLVLGLAGIFLFRKELLLLILPGLLAWYMTLRGQRRAPAIFAAIYGAVLLLAGMASLLPGIPNPLRAIVDRQQAFLVLRGNTRFKLTELSPSPSSFLQVFPEAFANTFLRPFIWEAHGPLQVMAALEVVIFWLLGAWVLLGRLRGSGRVHWPAWAWLVLFFSLIYYVLIGYVVPFPGAIVRYKAIPELLLLVLMVISAPGRRPPAENGIPLL